MENRKVPIEKDVDIELEYKIYSLYDKFKKRWKITLSLIVFFVVILLGYYYKKQLDIKKHEQASVLLAEIKEKVSKEDISAAEEIIRKFERDYKDTDYWKVVLAYKILIDRDKNIENIDVIRQLESLLSTDLKSGVKEYIAYVEYKNGKLKESKEKLLSIDQKNYNYFSARILLGFLYRRESDVSKAQEMFKQVSNSKYRYLSLIGRENM